jgi:ABC-type transport system involved in multi-copper enzyme maturation permease subunit
MVEKGNIDVLISKPISRFNILLSKYLGALLFIFASMVFLLGSMWLIISLKTGYWNVTFLYSAFSFTLTFAVMYSISVLIGLTIQSSIISILVNFFLIFVLCPLLSVRETLIFTFVKNDAVQFVFNFIYYIIPKPGEIKDITMYIITEQAIPFWKGTVNAEIGMVSPSWMSLISSVLFGIVVMSYSFYYFSKKDY